MASIKNAWNPGLNKQIRKKLKKETIHLMKLKKSIKL